MESTAGVFAIYHLSIYTRNSMSWKDELAVKGAEPL
jgi:hypothetical protein